MFVSKIFSYSTIIQLAFNYVICTLKNFVRLIFVLFDEYENFLTAKISQITVDAVFLISDFLKLREARNSLFIMSLIKFNGWLSICYYVSHSTDENWPFDLITQYTM